MRIHDYLKIAFSKAKNKNSKTLIGIVCISFSILFLILSNTINTTLEKHKKAVQSLSEIRTVCFTYNEDYYSYEELIRRINELNNDNITMIVNNLQNKIDITCNELIIENSQGSGLSLTGINKKEIEALGIDYSFSGNTAYEIILPSELSYYVQSDEYDEENLRYLTVTKTIDCTQFNGKEITILINNNKYNLKVIGTYDNNLLKDSKLYVPIELIQSLKSSSNYTEDTSTYIHIDENGIEHVRSQPKYIYVSVNDVLEVHELEIQLKNIVFDLLKINITEYGMPKGTTYFDYNDIPHIQNNVYEKMGVSEKAVKTFNIVQISLNAIAWIVLFSTLISINIKNLYEKSIEYGILKTQGFTNKNIQIISIIENIITTVISTIIAFILYLLMNFALSHLLNYLLDYNNFNTYNLQEAIGGLLNIKLTFDNTIIKQILIVLLISTISSYIINVFMLKRNIKDLLQEKSNIKISDIIPFIPKNKTIVSLISITILFLVIMTLSNIKIYMEEYFTNSIEQISYKEYDSLLTLGIENGVEMSLTTDISKEEFPCILVIHTYYNNAQYNSYNIKQLEKLPYIEKVYKNTVKIQEDVSYHYMLIIDNWKHSGIVKVLAQTYGYGVEFYALEINDLVTTYNIISTMLNIAILGITILALIIFTLYITRIILEEKENIGILKAVGYTNFVIWRKLSSKILCLIIIAYIINYLLLIGVNPIVDALLSNYGFEDFNVIVSKTFNTNILQVFIIIAIITSIYLMNKIKKMNVIDILK